ncbi:ACP S-malonyltransferase [Streptomyces sp. NL15-2K]|uniref:ACP S-malonyltransferase n=1 Tax=Streptomyces sp. NL15-2K TaxID=376149 RepID=UPI000F56B3ED|nr:MULTISPECIES: ACP S-malonyltransferase [Actinomycetes]WKX06485.1 ACP S-malonyltransferase [Kutzneria buriramensis]GCB43492.1 malonyl CoA-acyl carrier protein transacylase [Streptomyces sp. NL15-2K]
MTPQTGRRTVFMFSGQGSQHYQMGRELYDSEPVFRDALRRLDAFVEPELGGSVIARLYDPDRPVSEPFTDTAVTHPAIVMVELALAETLISYGVTPDLLLGASLGEYTAAVLAGVLEPGECLRRLVRMARSAGDAAPGGMVAVLAEPALYHREPDLHRDLELAARNYDAHFVVSGPLDALDRAETLLRARDIAYQRVPVSHGFHSGLMDPSRPAFDALWADTELRPPRIPLVSSATAGPVAEVTVEHLWRVARQPIEFAATVRALESHGPFLYLDAGPSGTLHNFVRANLAADPDSCSESLALLTPFTRDTQQLARVRDRAGTDGGRPATQALAPAAPHAKGGSKMKVFGFPGQGSQAKGMGADLFDEFPDLVAQADEILGYSIRDLCLNNPEGRLRRTEFTQPALYVVEALTYELRTREDPRPADWLVGHSLGEYAALFAADVFDFATGLRLVRRRGELMGRAVDGSMAAVLGLDLGTVESALSDSGLTALDIANHNAPEQIVLAGPAPDIDRARAMFEERGAQVVVLNVSAPFHSRYMRDAAEEFRELLDATEFRPPRIPVIANVDARPYRADRVRETLAGQIVGQVRWVDTVRRLMAQGDFEFEELGPGQALTKMVRKIRASSTPLPFPPTEPAPRPAATSAPVRTAPDRAEPPVRTEPPAAVPVVPAPAPALPAAPAAAPVAPAAPVPVARRGPAAEELGAEGFRARYGLRLAYLAGGMYGGISSEALVVRLAKAGGMGFFGTGGLPLAEVEAGIRGIQAALGPGGPFGVNLLHRHASPEQEQALVDLLLRLGVGTVEASGFLRITPALVKYRLKGGRIIAKVSRTDTAEAFLRPAPEEVVRGLAERGEVTEQEAARAAGLPMADDLCVEAGAGWHTDAADLATLLPAVLRLRDTLAGPWPRVHVGAAGGIGTPEAAAAALVLGAEFLVTGSVNQCTVEAATSAEVKDMLQGLDVQDTEPAPWSEMFELGVRARAVKRGVFLPARADRLYQLWRMHDSFADMDADTRRQIEETYLRRPFEDAWRAALAKNSPAAAGGREVDAKRKLALAFRSYLDDGFELARTGAPGRRVDYLVYCGPAMGAFNQWVKGTSLEPWQARNVDVLADRLLSGTARLLADRCASFGAAG